jgi:hypothetical protein
MRAAFLFLLGTFVLGCGRGNPSGAAPVSGFDRAVTDVETKRRDEERLKSLFTNERELTWDPPNTVASPYRPLTEFSKDVDSPLIRVQP